VALPLAFLLDAEIVVNLAEPVLAWRCHEGATALRLQEVIVLDGLEGTEGRFALTAGAARTQHVVLSELVEEVVKRHDLDGLRVDRRLVLRFLVRLFIVVQDSRGSLGVVSVHTVHEHLVGVVEDEASKV